MVEGTLQVIGKLQGRTFHYFAFANGGAVIVEGSYTLNHIWRTILTATHHLLRKLIGTHRILDLPTLLIHDSTGTSLHIPVGLFGAFIGVGVDHGVGRAANGIGVPELERLRGFLQFILEVIQHVFQNYALVFTRQGTLTHNLGHLAVQLHHLLLVLILIIDRPQQIRQLIPPPLPLPIHGIIIRLVSFFAFFFMLIYLLLQLFRDLLVLLDLALQGIDLLLLLLEVLCDSDQLALGVYQFFVYFLIFVFENVFETIEINFYVLDILFPLFVDLEIQSFLLRLLLHIDYSLVIFILKILHFLFQQFLQFLYCQFTFIYF